MPNPSGFGIPSPPPSPGPSPMIPRRKPMASQARGLHGDARDFLANHLSSGPADDPGSRKFHSNVMEKLTRLGGLTPGGPITAGMLSLLAGMENELVGGITEKVQGRPFISEQGFDPVDLDANLQGVIRGIRRPISPF